MIEHTESERQQALEHLRNKLTEILCYGHPYSPRGKAIRAAVMDKYQKWSAA